MLLELNEVEQSYRAVQKVPSGTPVMEVALRCGSPSRPCTRWLGRYQLMAALWQVRPDADSISLQCSVMRPMMGLRASQD